MIFGYVLSKKNKFMHFQRHILGEGGKLKKSIPSPPKNRMRNQKSNFFWMSFGTFNPNQKAVKNCPLRNIIN